MPTPSEFTEEYLVTWVKRKLGYPTIAIELADTTIEQNVEDTLEDFLKYHPKEKWQSQTLAKGKYIVDPPDGVEIFGVLNVEFVRAAYDSYENIEGALFTDPFYFLSAGGVSGIDVQTYDMVRHWIESMDKVFGSQEGYMYISPSVDNPGGQLLLQIPSQFQVSILWAIAYDLNEIPRGYQNLFKNILLARCRIDLGMIRSKFKGVPGAGGTVQLDGEELKQQGEQDLAKYTDELIASSTHYIPELA